MDITEAKRVISDRSHPLYERFYRSDKAVVAEVEQAFARNYPGNRTIDSELSPELQQALSTTATPSAADRGMGYLLGRFY